MLWWLCCPCVDSQRTNDAKIHAIDTVYQSRTQHQAQAQAPAQAQAQARTGVAPAAYKLPSGAKDNKNILQPPLINVQGASVMSGIQSAFAGMKNAATDFFHRAARADLGGLPQKKKDAHASKNARQVLMQFKIELRTELSAHDLLYFPGMIRLLESCLARTCRVSTDDVCIGGITDKLFPKSVFLNDGRIVIEYAVVIESKVFVEVQASSTDEAIRIAKNILLRKWFAEDATDALHRACVGELEDARFTAESIDVSQAVAAPSLFNDFAGTSPDDDNASDKLGNFKIQKTYEYVSNRRELHRIPFCDDILSDGEEELAQEAQALADIKCIENEEYADNGGGTPLHPDSSGDIIGPTAEEIKWAEAILEEDAKQHQSNHRASTFGFGSLIKTLVQARREQEEEHELQLTAVNLNRHFDEQAPSPDVGEAPSPDVGEGAAAIETNPITARADAHDGDGDAAVKC
jgi:hypothetical protein